jgi:hypothetical protein
MKHSTDKILASLTRDGRLLERYVLIANDEIGYVVFYDVEEGLSILHIEDEDAETAYVAFLRQSGARKYPSLEEFIRIHGDIAAAKAIPIKQ